jgi:autotransporter translocation and assembly factor TamB
MTTRVRRWLRIGSLVLTLFVGLVIVAIVTTQTAWFRDWVRRYVIREADGYLNGTLAIARLEGNLFTGIEIQGVTLTQGRETILAAKDVGLRYSLWDVISGDVVIDEIRINEPRLALSRGPAGWNVARLVKEQAQEADREGPAKPITISKIGISNGTVTIAEAEGPDSLGLPKRIERLDLQGSFAYQPVDFVIDLGHLSFRASEPALALNSLAGRIVVNQDDVTLERLAIRTAESALSLRGSVRSYLQTPTLNVALSSEKLTPREFAGFVPALADVRFQPALEATARGPLDALEAVLSIRSDAGTLSAKVVADAMGPERGVRGSATLGELDLSPVVVGLPASRVNATTQVDLTVDAGNEIDGRAALHVGPTAVDDYRVESLEAKATIVDSRVRLDADARAYGAHVTANGDVVAPLNGRKAAGELTGRIDGVDLRKLPRTLGAPALATRAGGRYRARLDGRGPSGELVFDASTVEGASIDAGTRVSGTLYGSRPTFALAGGIRDVDPHRFGTALRLPALTEARLRGRIDATFDVTGSGKTVPTLEVAGRVGVPRAALVGGEIRDAVADVRLTRGALDGTLAASFTNIDPGLAADRPPLAGAVSGSIEAALATPSITAFALPDSTGRVQLTLLPSRVGDHVIDRGALQASLANGVVDVASLDVAGPLADVSAKGTVAVAREGASNLQYRVVATDLAPAAALAGQQDIRGAGQVEGTLTGNRAELHSTGTLALSNAAYGTTARAVDTQVQFDVTLPDLDAQRIRLEAKTRAALVEAGGQSLREVTADVRYADRAAAFSANVAASDARTLEAAGTLVLPQPAGVDLRLDRLVATAEGASWSLASPARILYANDRVDVDRLALTSGAQRIEAAGAVAIGDTARSVPADRPLRLTLTSVDLAAVDRLARTGRGLGGILDGTATASGDLDAPVANAHVTVRDGKVGDFAYQSLDATVAHDATAARVQARLERGAEWLTLRGTLPPAPVLRDEMRRNAAPVDLHVESSAIDLAVAQALTPLVEQVTGTLNANVHLTGTLNAPVVDGGVRVANGGFRLTDEGTTFTNIQADIGLQADRVDVRQLQVADKDGHLMQVTGRAGVSLAKRQVGDVDLKVTSDDFSVLDGDFGRLHLDTDVTVSGSLQALRANGAITVGSGRIEVDRVLEELRPATGSGAIVEVAAAPSTSLSSSNPAPSAAVATDFPPPRAVAAAGPPAPAPVPVPAAAPSGPSMFDAMGLDVRVKVPNTLILRGDGVKIGGEGLSLGNLNMTLGGDLHATKAPGASTMVVGTVNTVRGYYEFQGRRFELRRDGTVSFKGPDPTNPQLDVTASRDVSGVEARVRVHGEAQRPELELSSTPPLDEGDILSLIIFNRPINDLGEGEKTTLAQRAGSLVGGFVAAPVAEALRDALDVDLLEISPVSDEGGTSVSVGNQIGERVFVKVRQQFGSSETTQLVMEYELSNLLRLETTVAQGGDTSRSIGRRAERGAADLVFVVKY